jgi:hypothetical protein
MPSLDLAFCGMGVAIDYLKVWQAPKIEQLRPRQILLPSDTPFGYIRGRVLTERGGGKRPRA